EPQVVKVKVAEKILQEYGQARRGYETSLPLDAPEASLAEFGFLLARAVEQWQYYLAHLKTPQNTMPVLFDTCRFERYARILHAGIEALRGAPEDAEATGVLRHAVEAMRAALFETIIWQTLACLDITAGGAQDSPAAAAQD